MTNDKKVESLGKTRLAPRKSYQARWPSSRRPALAMAGFGLLASVAVVLTLILFLLGARAYAALILGVTILVLVLGALLVMLRLSERALRLTRHTEGFAKETRSTLGKLHTDIDELLTEMRALKESNQAGHSLTRKRIREKHDALQRSQEQWHSLTRKRLREKHDSIRREVRSARTKNLSQHELTRKRIREKSSALTEHVQFRIDRSDRLRRRAFRDLYARLDASEHVTEEDTASLRKVIFDILQEGKRVSPSHGSFVSGDES